MTQDNSTAQLLPRAAFTPGPWHVDRENGNRFIMSPIETQDEMGETHLIPVCDMHRGGYDFSDIGYSIEANADLIAAAPQMFGALHHMMLEFGSDIKAYDADLYHAAYDALAKARGEQ